MQIIKNAAGKILLEMDPYEARILMDICGNIECRAKCFTHLFDCRTEGRRCRWFRDAIRETLYTEKEIKDGCPPYKVYLRH